MAFLLLVWQIHTFFDKENKNKQQKQMQNTIVFYNKYDIKQYNSIIQLVTAEPIFRIEKYFFFNVSSCYEPHLCNRLLNLWR